MSDTNGKVKLYRNPSRTQPEPYKPYVPQYQVHGKEPQEYQGAIVPGGIAVARPTALPSDNPRARRAPVRQPYAETTVSPIGRGRGPVPNVGNNMEHSWSSVDGDIVDDLSNIEIDANHQMIDNNDFLSDQAFGFQNGLNASDIKHNFTQLPPLGLEQEVEAVHQPADSDDLSSILADLTDEDYLLIVNGVPVCSGPKEEIEDQARALVFGEHAMCDGNPVPVDDIVILKRVKVKVGLFLE
jgi:hypothetical protein